VGTALRAFAHPTPAHGGELKTSMLSAPYNESNTSRQRATIAALRIKQTAEKRLSPDQRDGGVSRIFLNSRPATN
jgi:hypothetical protein